MNANSSQFPPCACSYVRLLFGVFIVGVFVLVYAAGTDLAVAQPADPVDFQRDIVPLLQERCIRCHQPANRKGDISLATARDLMEAGYIVPGLPDQSYLVELVTSTGTARPRMPKEGKVLTEEEVRRLRQWITQGAPWPAEITIQDPRRADKNWWSLQPLAVTAPPDLDALGEELLVGPAGKQAPYLADWFQHPVDRFVLSKLRQHGLLPSPPADRRTLIRRVTFDLTGLPPTPEEVEAFVADQSPDAYERLVDRLLASPQYGEQWGRHWLDVVRFGESNGFERNVLIHDLWPFRDYVIESFNRDKPFDRFVKEQLAGDVLEPGRPEVEIGTAFLVCGPYDNVGNQDPRQAAIIRANTIDEIIRAVGETFLGFTIGCARCHDHKFDPITQQDYYAWYATFAGVQHGSRIWASEEQRQARAAAVSEATQARDQVQREIDALQAAIQKRAQEKAADHEALWKRPPVSRVRTEEEFGPVEAQWVRLTVLGLDTNPRAQTGYRIDEFEVWTDDPQPRNVALQTEGAQAQGRSREAEDFRGAYSVRLVQDGRFGERWIAQSPELTIRLAKPERIRRVVFSSDRTGEAGALPEATFVSDYKIDVSVDGRQWTTVATSEDRQPVNDVHRQWRLFHAEITADEKEKLAQLSSALQAANARLNAIPGLPTAWMGNFVQPPSDIRVFLRGDPQQLGQATPPASLAMLDAVTASYRLPPDAPEGLRRLRLAEWLTAPDNPLPARVLANRLWHYHFGTGLVDTPSDFGFMGGRPTHPELLDWLASQLRAYQWQLKPMHRLIVTSQTYRQSSDLAANPSQTDPMRVDAASRLYWRFPPRRLTGEQIRDSMLAISGVLDNRMGGPGFRLYKYLEDNVATYVPLDKHGPETYRRAVYHQNARAARVDLLSDFDAPDPALAAPCRIATVTPLQSLTLLNHSFTLDMASFFAERVERQVGMAPLEAVVDRVFLLAYARLPDPQERDKSCTLVRSFGLRALCRAIWNSNEFLYLR